MEVIDILQVVVDQNDSDADSAVESSSETKKAAAAVSVIDPTVLSFDMNSFIVEIKGDLCLNLRGDSKRPYLQNFLTNITDFIDWQTCNQFGGVFPLAFIAEFSQHILDHQAIMKAARSGKKPRTKFENLDSTDKVVLYHINNMWHQIVDKLEQYATVNEEIFQRNLVDGNVSFNNLKKLIEPGTAITYSVEDKIVGGIVRSVDIERSYFGNRMNLNVEIISAVTGSFAKAAMLVQVGEYSGVHPIIDLPFNILKKEDEPPVEMTARGAKVQEYMKPGTIARYGGNLVQASYWNSRSYRSHGRIMIDPMQMQVMASDAWNTGIRASGVTLDDNQQRRQRSVTPAVVEVHKNDLWRVWPFLYGFSMSVKRWGRFSIDDVMPIAWREDAFDFLVMPEADKKIIHSLVKYHGTGYEDVITDKGGGCIFLLAGAPGQGKTLLAETVAETLKRPLYSISVGELGTDPVELEASLRGILDLAVAWNAVMLLDEADIFLEARDSKDIVRNSMVGVLLRLAEYHQGVMFLTTNRADNIDKAFHSRISVTLHFPEADREKRKSIWGNLLTSAGYDTGIAKHCYDIDLNGRQIKNCIRTAQTLAKADGVKMNEHYLQIAIDFNTRNAVSGGKKN